MTRKCPTCGGDGIVYSEASAAIDDERRLRALAAGSRSQAFRVEVADSIASALVGPGARRLVELEALTKKRFFLVGKPQTHLDHFVVLAEGKLADVAPQAPVEEGAEVMLQLVEVDRHDASAAVGKLDGLDVVVADAAQLVGKRLKVRVERVLEGRAYGVPTRKAKEAPEPLTAEAEAEKPTRKPPARKTVAAAEDSAVVEEEAPEVEVAEAEAAEPEPEAAEPEAEGTEDDEAPKPKKKTRRGSRGGKRRKKPATTGEEAAEAELEAGGASEETPEPSRAVTIHVPGDDLGRPEEAETVEVPAAGEVIQPGEPSEDGAEAPKPAKKKTRRGSRGGRNRKKKPAGAAAQNGDSAAAEPQRDAEPEPEPVTQQEPEPSADGEFEYVPMSEWLDEIDAGR
jgi:predicted RNA-binding protein with TRAM domain